MTDTRAVIEPNGDASWQFSGSEDETRVVQFAGYKGNSLGIVLERNWEGDFAEFESFRFDDPHEARLTGEALIEAADYQERREARSGEVQNLTYKQRKWLRRIGRGQTVPTAAFGDPVIQECITTAHYIQPPNLSKIPYPDSMVMWCDYEAAAHKTNRPRLNAHGKKLLAKLDKVTEQ